LISRLKGQKIVSPERNKNEHTLEDRIILYIGIGLLLFVPFFHSLTNMPPFMGMLLALGIIWLVGNLIHISDHPDIRYKYSVTKALRNIEVSSVLFFLGILLAVSVLQSSGILAHLTAFITMHIRNVYTTGTILGLFSAIIDNVPLVAAVQGMFSLDIFPKDNVFWDFLALSTGTGGSIIIIGSAAGVAIMGIEKIDFFWYLKNISWIALIGFLSGLITFILQQWMTS
jgi:Na+/H+ antiporter NhaD/arsenite permease-like protein